MKRLKTLRIILAITIFFSAVALVIAIRSNPNAFDKQETKTTSVRKVTYKVFGSKGLVISVTQRSEAGATSQFNRIKAPYNSGELYFNKGEFVYLSAQNQNNNGEVIVDIFVDGELYKSTKSEGEFCIASVSGILK